MTQHRRHITICLRLTSEELRRLDAAKYFNNTTRTEWVRRAIDERLTRERTITPTSTDGLTEEGDYIRERIYD